METLLLWHLHRIMKYFQEKNHFLSIIIKLMLNELIIITVYNLRNKYNF